MKLILQNIVKPFYAEDDEIISAAADKMRRLGINPRALHLSYIRNL